MKYIRYFFYILPILLSLSTIHFVDLYFGICATILSSLGLLIKGVIHESSKSNFSTKIMTINPEILLVRKKQITKNLLTLEDSNDLLKSVFFVSATVASCVTKDSIYKAYKKAIGLYWSFDEINLFLWEKGEWSCLNNSEIKDEPIITAAISIPNDEEKDLMMDLSPGIEGQSVLILKNAKPQPTLSNRNKHDRQYITEILRGQFALSLRKVILHQNLQELSRQDSLTTLFRRWYGMERLKEMFDSFLVTVAMIDIDHFKKINDSLGHRIGDKTLKKIGTYLSTKLRPGDIVCRYGGEEFLAIFPKTNEEGIKIVAERIRQDIENLKIISYPVTVSIGYAVKNNDKSMEELIERADIALYNGKKAGRNKVFAG